jgi:phosphocarrier protein HPr
MIYKQKIEIQNIRGLHARASAKFVQMSETFVNTDITVTKDDDTVSALSIMGLMMLSASKGTFITICVTDNDGGNDAETALQALCDLVRNKFGEEE